jgi:hypothetical protein
MEIELPGLRSQLVVAEFEDLVAVSPGEFRRTPQDQITLADLSVEAVGGGKEGLDNLQFSPRRPRFQPGLHPATGSHLQIYPGSAGPFELHLLEVDLGDTVAEIEAAEDLRYLDVEG